jgi:hypothetical protein
MNKDQKPDAQEIQAYIDELQNADWIDPFVQKLFIAVMLKL